MRCTSSSFRPEPPSILICCSLAVPRSLAVTWMIPFASMSNATSTCGTPRGAGGADLIGFAALVRVLADQLLALRLHRRHAGHAADEDDVVDLRRVEPGVRERLLRRADRTLEQIVCELLELRARELQVEVLR